MFDAGGIEYTIDVETDQLLTANRHVGNFNTGAQRGFEKTETKVSKLARTIKNELTLGALKNATAAVIAFSGAVAASSVAAANSVKEQQLFAKRIGVSYDEVGALDFALKQYNMTAEQMSDMTKDMKERLGEFLNEGTGEFDPFIKAMNLTSSEARILAEEWQHLSGPQILGNMINMMQSAGLTTVQMSAALEAMASDSSLLTDAFLDQGKAINDLKKEYKDINGETQLTEQQQKDLIELGKSWDLMIATISKSSKQFLADIGPKLSEMFNGISVAISAATKAYSDFINETKKGVASGVNVEIFKTGEEVDRLRDRIEQLKKQGEDSNTSKFLESVGTSIQGEIATAEAKLVKAEERLAKLRGAKADGATDVDSEGVAIVPDKATKVDGSDGEKEKALAQARLDAMAKEFSNERQLIEEQNQLKKDIRDGYTTKEFEDIANAAIEKEAAAKERFERAKEIASEQNLSTQELEREHQATLLAIDEEFELARTELIKEEEQKRLEIKLKADAKAAAEREKAQQLGEQSLQNSFNTLTGVLMSGVDEQSGAYKVLYALQKAYAIASILANTEMAAAAVMAHDAAILGLGAAASASVIRGLGYASAGAVAGTAIAGMRRFGGEVKSGAPYQINESGVPEVYSAGGKDFLMASENAKVTPMNQMGGSNVNVTVNNNAPGVDVVQGTDSAGGITLDIVKREAAKAAQGAYNRVAEDLSQNRGKVFSAARQGTNLTGKAGR
jgi:hypothetical protein